MSTLPAGHLDEITTRLHGLADRHGVAVPEGHAARALAHPDVAYALQLADRVCSARDSAEYAPAAAEGRARLRLFLVTQLALLEHLESLAPGADRAAALAAYGLRSALAVPGAADPPGHPPPS